MKFEVFDKPSERVFSPTATIAKEGTIRLNQGSVNKFGLQKWDYVTVGIDADTRHIGLAKCDYTRKSAAKLRKTNGGLSLTCKAFLDYIGIDYTKETTRKPVRYDEATETIIISIYHDDETGVSDG